MAVSYPMYASYIPELTESTVREVLTKLNMKVRTQEIIDLVMGRYELIHNNHFEFLKGVGKVF